MSWVAMGAHTSNYLERLSCLRDFALAFIGHARTHVSFPTDVEENLILFGPLFIEIYSVLFLNTFKLSNLESENSSFIYHPLPNVELDCGPKIMTVKLLFDKQKVHQFSDWILVGNAKDGLTSPECKLRGTGDLQYLIEMPVMSGPCGTRAIAPGIYENVISIKKHPNLILTGDQNITVRCAYGAPEVATAAVPFTTLAGRPLTTFKPRPSSNPIGSPTSTSTSSGSILPASTVYLIIFSALFSSLLFLFCGAVVFFLKRRAPPTSKRLTPSSKIGRDGPATVAAAADVFSSVCASSIVSDGSIDDRRSRDDRTQKPWWANKKRKNQSHGMQRYESSHDYMVSTSVSSRGRPVSIQGMDFRDNMSMNLDLNEKVRAKVDKVYTNSSSNKTVLRSIPEELDSNHRRIKDNKHNVEDDKIESVSLSTLDGGSIYHCLPLAKTDGKSNFVVTKNDSADFLPTPPPVPSKKFCSPDDRKQKIFTKESYFDIFRKTVDYQSRNLDCVQSQTEENRVSYLDRSNCEIYEELPTLKVLAAGEPVHSKNNGVRKFNNCTKEEHPPKNSHGGKALQKRYENPAVKYCYNYHV